MKMERIVSIFLLAILCLGMTMFAFPSRSDVGDYNPWYDINDDGKINMVDVATVARAYGASGEPIDKTALLIDLNATCSSLLSRVDDLNSSLIMLQSEVDNLNITNLMPLIDSLNASLLELRSQTDSLNASVTQLLATDTYQNILLAELQASVDSVRVRVSSLEGQVAIINATIASMYATLTQQQASIDSLNSSLTSLMNRVSALEANYSVTNLMLAPYAIPINSTYVTSATYTTETMNMIDMSGMSVDITLNRTSLLLVMFSGLVYNDNNNAGYLVWLQAVVDSNPVQPNPILANPNMYSALGSPLTHIHTTWSNFSYDFYAPSVQQGKHSVKIQWKVTGGTGIAGYKTLMVIALPT